MGNWLAFPHRQQPRLWIGPGDKVANALRLYGPYSRLGIVSKQLVCALPDFVARRLLPKVKIPDELARLECLSTYVRKLLDEPHAAISVSPGTVGLHRKITAQVSVRGQVIAYAKMAETPAVASLLRRERDNLVDLGNRPVLPFEVPRLIDFRDDGAQAVLIQTAAPPGCTPASIGLSAAGLTLVQQLAGLAAGECDLSKILDSNGCQASVIDHSSRLNAFRFLNAHFGSERVRTSYAHGDFAPWNLLMLPGEIHYLFDWEYAHSEHPLLTDLFHYLFMPACLVCGQDPRTTVATVSQMLANDVVRRLLASLGVAPPDVPAYFLLYLLGLDSRQAHIGIQRMDFVGSCLHHVLVRARYADERPKVLVAAYACEPGQGSEPGVGWHMAQAISAQHEAWVITRRNNRLVIAQALEVKPNPNLHFIYVDLPKWAMFWKKGGRGVRTYYYLWQLRAWWAARRLCRQVSFDLAHHVTFVSDWLYTFLALLPLPFVWGPIGTNPPVPRKLAFNCRSLITDRLRIGFQQLVRVIDPLFWLSLARASLLIGIDHSVFDRLPLRLAQAERRLIHSAIGVEQLVDPLSSSEPRTSNFTVLCVGRFLPIKGFHLAIAAFARFATTAPHSRLVIIGKGELVGHLEDYARSLQVDNKIEFRAWAPRDIVLEAMGNADVFLFPSFEGGGMVVLEALGNGLPVVCLDYGGPGAMVGPGAGVKVAVGDKETTIAALAAALTHYATHPEERRAAGWKARRHAIEHHLWSSRPNIIARWYATMMTLEAPDSA